MAMPDDAPAKEHVNGDDTHGDAAGVNNKRKAETEAPSESTPPVSKRNNHSAAAPPDEAAGAEPPGDAGADAEQTGEERAEEGEGGVPPPEGEGEPQAEAAPPPAHDPAYAAAAFPEPASMPEQAAPAVSGTVGYSMPAYDGVSGSYAFPVDHLLVGRIIGKGGDTIRQIQFASGAHIDINQQVPEGQPRMVCISGLPGAIQACRSLLDDLLRTPVAATPGALAVPPGGMERNVLCPRQYVGRIIGRQGDVIKGLQAITGARIQIDQTSDPCSVSITGSAEAVESCSSIVADIANGGHTAQYSYAAYVSRTAAGAWAQSGGPPATGAYGVGAPGMQAAYGGMDPYAAYYSGGYPGVGGYVAPAYGAPQAYGGAPGGQAMPGQQWVVGDDGKGNTYYFNSVTGVSQWEKPADFVG